MTGHRDTNCTNHFLIIDDATGDTITTEKGKNALGGFQNIMRRLEVRFGGRLRPAGDSGRFWSTPDGQVIRIEQWNRL